MIANFNFNTIQILHCLFHTNFLCLFRPYFIWILHCILYEFLCVFPYKIFSAFHMNFHEFWMLYPWNNESDCNIWIFWCKSSYTLLHAVPFYDCPLFSPFSQACTLLFIRVFLAYTMSPLPPISVLSIFLMKIVVCNKVWIFYLACQGGTLKPRPLPPLFALTT